VAADGERLLGADHPDTLLFRNNLAMACQAAGETRRVLPLLERAAADGERLLGADHPNTLSFRRQPGRRLSRPGRCAAGDPAV
jgi:hypothetical protein